jgi:hypothetical protein
MPSEAEVADRFMAEHVVPKRKVGTAEFYFTATFWTHVEARRGHHPSRQGVPRTGRKASFKVRQHTVPSQPCIGGSRKHVCLCSASGHCFLTGEELEQLG